MRLAPLIYRDHWLSNELWFRAFGQQTVAASPNKQGSDTDERGLHCTRIVTLKMEADSETSDTRFLQKSYILNWSNRFVLCLIKI